MDVQKIISELQSSPIIAECSCGENFRLKDALLFDGLGKIPSQAQEGEQKLKEEITDLLEDLKTRMKRAKTGAAVTAKAVGLGKNLEKILPTVKGFPYQAPDCRFLADPIDLLVFEGLANNRIKSIQFFEVKSGNARLTKGQKSIKEAIEDHNVEFKVLK